MLIFFFYSLIILYLIAIGFLFREWNKIKAPSSGEIVAPAGLLKISVLVVVRNEAAGISKLLQDLSRQRFPPGAFEVIIVDDHSSDATGQIVEETAGTVSFKLRLFSLQAEQGKKAGLELGIKHAAGPVILVTDGDCRVPAGWLAATEEAFRLRKAAFVAGAVTFSGEKNLFEKMQTIEFASLVGSGAAMLEAGIPGMCNAANMAFRKDIYEQIQGLSRSSHIPSGDDEFLLQEIYRKFPDRAFYLKSPEAVVRTRARQSWGSFYQQRKRWAGKWYLHRKLSVALTAIGLYVFYALLLTVSAGMLLNQVWIYFFAGILLKFGAEFLFLRSVLQSFNKRILPVPFFLLQVVYPFYVLFFGIAVNIGSFTWKGRTYNYAKL